LVDASLHLVDFGLSSELESHVNSIYSIISNFQAMKNQFFTSKWVLSGHPYTKRDDVIAIVYNLLFLMDSQDSWFATKLNTEYSELVEFRLKADASEICGGNRCEALIPLYEEVYSYGLNEKPNYGKLKFLLEMELVDSFCKPDKFY